MNDRKESDIIDAKLSLQRALLGEVSSNLRAVAFSLAINSLELRYYFDGEIGEDDAESVSRVESEVLADYTEDVHVHTECIRCDSPDPIMDSGIWVYQRRECSW